MIEVPALGTDRMVLLPDEDLLDERLFNKDGKLRTVLYRKQTRRHGHGEYELVSMSVPGYYKNGRQAPVSLGRLVLGLEAGDRHQADHINHDVFDNRFENLRVVTQSQNQQNRSGPSRRSTTGARGVSVVRTRQFGINVVRVNLLVVADHRSYTVQRQKRAHLADQEWIDQTVKELSELGPQLRAKYMTHAEGR